ncbi:MAG: pentapeptide repeat-containing protein [Clostridiaceae bacterium]|nr:pentapeptide repeat-containing protein [Clostridiaceae bacterium]
MKKEKLDRALAEHHKWLDGEGGQQADLSFKKLKRVDLRSVDLSKTNLYYTHLTYANLNGAVLREANMRFTDLWRANLKDADLTGTNLFSSRMTFANLSGAKGLVSPIDFLNENFEKTDEGYIVFKIFDYMYPSPKYWKIKPGSIISEVVNYCRTADCGCGVNVSTLAYIEDIRRRTDGHIDLSPVWRCLLRWEWLAGVCVPYMTTGQIRCEKIQLIEEVHP